jgi:hypothetical protein
LGDISPSLKTNFGVVPFARLPGPTATASPQASQLRFSLVYIPVLDIAVLATDIIVRATAVNCCCCAGDCFCRPVYSVIKKPFFALFVFSLMFILKCSVTVVVQLPRSLSPLLPYVQVSNLHIVKLLFTLPYWSLYATVLTLSCYFCCRLTHGTLTLSSCSYCHATLPY